MCVCAAGNVLRGVVAARTGTDPTVREVRVLPKFSPGKKPVEMLTFVQNWGILLSMSRTFVQFPMQWLVGLRS